MRKATVTVHERKYMTQICKPANLTEMNVYVAAILAALAAVGTAKNISSDQQFLQSKSSRRDIYPYFILIYLILYSWITIRYFSDI